MCISLVSVCCAAADLSDKNAQLIKAAYDGNLLAVQALLAGNADVNTKDKDGVTTLYMARRKTIRKS